MLAAEIGEVVSPHGGPTAERKRLSERYGPRLSLNEHYSRKVVSYQGNRNVPGLRWMKYKEGFSSQLVAELVMQERPQSVLDPFAGICTTPLVASGLGSEAVGIEIMPVGILAGSAIADASNGLSKDDFSRQSRQLLEKIRSSGTPHHEHAFKHVRITHGAFSPKTEAAIAKARCFIEHTADPDHKSLLNLACMSVLEESSYTRKDGQYLRWDKRAPRQLRSSSVDKGNIPAFDDALETRLTEIAD